MAADSTYFYFVIDLDVFALLKHQDQLRLLKLFKNCRFKIYETLRKRYNFFSANLNNLFIMNNVQFCSRLFSKKN
ncbi:hypothetical protein BpHYR1_020699 [Brachionus plicatilis]|uniref:Uncharacterized protein n=1 Tax=Brachionus plicatilis TaxID=10195 RepID=A0A3M7PHR2_BRAPC|nr:hypothetical protein BpHYR1_020699 [Brachionus plicatilis]